MPRLTPRPVVRKIVHLRWKQRLGQLEIAARLGSAASTVHLWLRRRGIRASAPARLIHRG